MPDSGIERTLVLPEIPIAIDVVMRVYLRDLHDKISASYDTLATRINEFLTFQEWQSNTPVQITADQTNYVLPDDGIVFRFSTDVSRAMHGIKAPLVERFIILLNTGAADLTIPHQSASAIAENRIMVVGGGTLTLAPTGQSMALWYDLQIARWRQLML